MVSMISIYRDSYIGSIRNEKINSQKFVSQKLIKNSKYHFYEKNGGGNPIYRIYIGFLHVDPTYTCTFPILGFVTESNTCI
jgi:hypothetical protein